MGVVCCRRAMMVSDPRVSSTGRKGGGGCGCVCGKWNLAQFRGGALVLLLLLVASQLLLLLESCTVAQWSLAQFRSGTLVLYYCWLH